MKDSLFDNINLETVSKKKYKCGDFLSEGAFSKVYTCVLIANNSKFVVKIQPRSESFSYAVNEINILNKLKKHKSEFGPSNNIEFVDYYVDDSYFYTVFERCDMDLHTFNIMFIQRYKCRIPLFLTKYITKSIINGVNELNKNNIIHCDIKSDNVLLKFSKATVKANGKKIKLNEVYDFFKLYDQFIIGKTHMADIINSFSIKLIDFNKSQFINQICKDNNIQILYYQAPEVVFGDEFNESVDMWSIGCIIYELITGHQLFDIYNKKSKYGELYENYEIQNEDDSTNGSGDSKSVSSYSNSSYYDNNTSYYDDNKLENYVFLLKVISIIGPLPSLPSGKHVDTYITNNKILGGIQVNVEGINDLILKDKINHKSSNFDTEIVEFIDLLHKIFVYDINKRVKASDII